MKSNALWAIVVVLMLGLTSVGLYVIVGMDVNEPHEPNDGGQGFDQVPYRGKSNFIQVPFSYNYESSDIDPVEDVCYYTDDFFKWPSTLFDQSLASASICLTMASFSSKYHGPSTLLYGDGKDLLEGMGFTNVDANDDFKIEAGQHTIGVVVGMKRITCTVQNDTTVIAIGIRGNGYGNEWASNFTIGTGEDSEGHHKGFYDSRGKVLEFLKGYVKDNRIIGDVKLWVTGFSRGAGVANTLSGMMTTAVTNGESPLGDNVFLKREGIYTYTFGTPTTAFYDDSGRYPDPRSETYDNIWSILNHGDLITKIMFEGCGFERYGKDVVISDPGQDGYDEKKIEVLRYFNEFAPLSAMKTYFADDFEPYRIDFTNILNFDELILPDPDCEYDNLNDMMDASFESTSKIMGGRDWYVENVQVAINNLYDVVCGDDNRFNLTLFFRLMVYLTMEHEHTHIIGILGDILFGKSIANDIVNDVRTILQVMGRDVTMAETLSDEISNLILRTKELLFSNDPLIINCVITLGMNMDSIGYCHNPTMYHSWLKVNDPSYSTA